jgi:hypothetical protein
MLKKQLLCYSLLVVISTESFAQNDNFDINLYKSVEKTRKEKQATIKDYNNLAGTYWVIENPQAVEIFWGLMFLENNTVVVFLVLSQAYLDETCSSSYTIISINGSSKYNVMNDMLTIGNQFSCYLENSSLFVKDNMSYDGYIKYKLLEKFVCE